MNNRLILVFLLISMLTTPVLAGEKAVPGIPPTLNYQGRLTWLNGLPLADGNYEITLRIWDADARGMLLWAETQTVFVYDSVFSAVLGETTPLLPAVDFAQSLWLGVEVPTIFAGEMSPRIPLTATPYSFIAGDLDSGVAVRSLNGLTESVNLVPGTGMTITPSGNNLILTATGGGGGGADADWGINGNDMYSLPSGHVGIGTTTPTEILHVGSSTGGANLKVEDFRETLLNPSQAATIVVETGLGSGKLTMATTTSGNRNLELSAQSSGTDLNLKSTDEIRMNYRSRLQFQRFFTNVAEFNDFDELIFFDGEEEPVMIRGQDPTGSADGGEVQLGNGSGVKTVRLDGYRNNNFGGTVELYGDTGNLTLALRAKRNNTANSGLAQFYDEAGIQTIRLAAQNLGTDGDRGGIISLYNHLGSETVKMSASENGNPSQGGVLKLYDESGNLTIELDGDYGSTNEGRITTNTLEITGGADFSEQFDISSTITDIAPGQVVCIDPNRPGELKLSDKAYDTCVAGIISGAGGVRPGMIMGQRGSVADGAHPVALTGRVYVRADATSGAIKPGDLLTTSEIPGHAMKVEDANLAQGAVLGKAMTSLDHGRGLVLVLVSLQ